MWNPPDSDYYLATITTERRRFAGYAAQLGAVRGRCWEITRTSMPHACSTSTVSAVSAGLTTMGGVVSAYVGDSKNLNMPVIAGLGAVSAGLTTMGGVVLTMPVLAGFGTDGVLAGSVAAAWQSSIGSVAAGSNFAALQTFGATMPTAPALGVGLMVAGVGGVGYIGWRRYTVHPRFDNK